MPFEHLSIKSGAGITDADPGIMTVNGTGFNANFLPQAIGYGEENTAGNAAWFPYDRGIQVPTPTTWATGTFPQYGLFFWNRNQILQIDNTTGSWTDILTISDQQNLWDWGIHTGLYEVWGSDGRLYVCGIYPGATSTNFVGAISYSTATDTWTDTGELDLGSFSRFTNCKFCISWNERLWLCTENKLYSFDPVANTLLIESLTGVFTSSHHQSPFVLGQRFFLAGIDGSQLKIFERVGGAWTELADLGQISISASLGTWDYALTQTQVIFFFNSVDGGSSGYRCVEVTTFDSNVGGFLTVDDISFPVLQNYTNVFQPGGTSNPDVRFWSSTDSSAFPDQAPQNNVHLQEATGFPEPWQTLRFVDKNTPLAGLGPAFGGGNSYISDKNGAGGFIYSAPTLPSTQRKIVVARVQPADTTISGGLRVSYWAFGTTATASVRIRVTYPVSPVSSQIRAFRGTIHSVISGGTLSSNQINNVPVNTSGGGLHEFIWDREADGWKPWLVFGLSVELSD